MPNRNYITGRRFEYKVRDQYRAKGYTAVRTAGSHGPHDVIAYLSGGDGDYVIAKEIINGVEYRTLAVPITGYAIQCKRRKVKHAPDRVPAKRRTRPAKALPAVSVPEA